MKSIKATVRDKKSHWVGDGFLVRSMFSYNEFKESMSPFLLMDYAGPSYFEASSTIRGVEEHPHRGFETVTIVYDGEVKHKDSTGASGLISKGDVQWMTAASGIVHEEMHSEAFTKSGGNLEMVQLWVNLPAKDKMSKPKYQDILSKNIPVKTLNNDTVKLRLIAGSYEDIQAVAHTFTPLNLWDISMKAGAEFKFSLPENHNSSIFLLKGKLEVNKEAELKDAQLVIFERDNEEIVLKAQEDSTLLLLSGEPIDEALVGYGPFVMNTHDEITQALEDYRSGKLLSHSTYTNLAN